MLNRISNKEVQGETFSIFVPNIHHVQYKENNHIAMIEIEGEMKQKGVISWLIYQQTLKGWESPHEYEVMSAKKREEIFMRVSQCLSLLDMPHHFAESICFSAAKGKTSPSLH
jgi:hypothetical protein